MWGMWSPSGSVGYRYSRQGIGLVQGGLPNHGGAEQAPCTLLLGQLTAAATTALLVCFVLASVSPTCYLTRRSSGVLSLERTSLATVKKKPCGCVESPLKSIRGSASMGGNVLALGRPLPARCCQRQDTELGPVRDEMRGRQSLRRRTMAWGMDWTTRGPRKTPATHLQIGLAGTLVYFSVLGRATYEDPGF